MVKNSNHQKESTSKDTKIDKKIQKMHPKNNQNGKKENKSEENPQITKMKERNDQKDSLRKMYQKILTEIKVKKDQPLRSINDFLNYLKKSASEVHLKDRSKTSWHQNHNPCSQIRKTRAKRSCSFDLINNRHFSTHES